MNSAVIVFPGSNCDRDLAVALEQVTGRKPAMVWHRDNELPAGVDLIAVPGGFSYGDYLRSGAMAANSPVMRAVREAADRGVAVLGGCNGFQRPPEGGKTPAPFPQPLRGGRGDRHSRRPPRRQLPGRCGKSVDLGGHRII